jgi:hypothetical protein
MNRLAGIVRGREEDRAREQARIGCRYNSGRERELRKWNSVNAGQARSGYANEGCSVS